MRGLAAFAVLVLLALFAAEAQAQLTRSPTRTTVSTDAAGSFTVLYQDTGGALFTSTEAVFCSVDPNAGTGGVGALSCTGGGGTVLGRLPSALDVAATAGGASRFTDIVSVPYSVVRRGVVQARQGTAGTIFYVRRFDRIGVGLTPRYVTVTIGFGAGVGNTPLSLTRITLYGEEPGAGRVRLVRVDDSNIASGVVKADILFSGSGVFEGWWELHAPGDLPLREIDRFTEASLSLDQRGQQRHFRRIKRFRLPITGGGRVNLVGPRYDELPTSPPGRYQVLLRVAASRAGDRIGSLAALPDSGNTYRGAVAGFPIEALDYWVGRVGAGFETLRPRAVIDMDAPGGAQIAVAWTPGAERTAVVVVEIEDGPDGEPRRLAVPIGRGYAVLPQDWLGERDPAAVELGFSVLGADRRTLADDIEVIR